MKNDKRRMGGVPVALFLQPVIVLSGIIASVVATYAFTLPVLSQYLILGTILFGSLDLIRDTVRSLVQRKFALDYIALVAITTGVISNDYLVAAIIVLMLTGGQTLEKYAVARAKKSLTNLIDRIPDSVLLWENNDISKMTKISEIQVGNQIFVRKGEVIPLDGVLYTDAGISDESSLTGEPYEIEKVKGDVIRSGTINIGKPMVITVTKSDQDSTYRKIIEMVRAAQDNQTDNSDKRKIY